MFARQTRALLLLCSMFSTQVLSQVYSWVDENAQKHFGSQPPAAQPGAEPMSINHGGGI